MKNRAVMQRIPIIRLGTLFNFSNIFSFAKQYPINSIELQANKRPTDIDRKSIVSLFSNIFKFNLYLMKAIPKVQAMLIRIIQSKENLCFFISLYKSKKHNSQKNSVPKTRQVLFREMYRHI